MAAAEGAPAVVAGKKRRRHEVREEARVGDAGTGSTGADTRKRGKVSADAAAAAPSKSIPGGAQKPQAGRARKGKKSKRLPAFSKPRNPSLPTPHLFVGNTGPALGVPLEAVLAAFAEYGRVVRVVSEHPKRPYVIVSFATPQEAAAARQARNRPESARDTTFCSPTHMPAPGEPQPLRGRWLKVDFAEARRPLDDADTTATVLEGDAGAEVSAAAGGAAAGAGGGDSGTSVFDVLSRDTRLAPAAAGDPAKGGGGAGGGKPPRVECPLCLGLFARGRGLRSHLASDRTGRGHGLAGDALVEVMQKTEQVKPAGGGPAGGGGEGRGLRAKLRPNEKRDQRKGSGADAGLAAAGRGDTEELEKLVKGGWSPATADRNGSTAMHWACGAGHLEAAKLLAKHGCPVDAACSLQRQPLHWAARNGHVDVVAWLVEERGVPIDVPTKDGITALHWAVWRGQRAAARWLVEHGAAMAHVNSFGCNAQHWVALSDEGDVDTAAWLKTGGVDPRATNNQGHTPLHKAAWRGHVSLAKWLTSADGGAAAEDASLADDGGYTPVQIAKLAGHVELAELLGGVAASGGAGGSRAAASSS